MAISVIDKVKFRQFGMKMSKKNRKAKKNFFK